MFNASRIVLLCITVMTVALATAAPAAPATLTKPKTIVKFNGVNGEDVFASLTQGSDGNLYGTTAFGGANGSGTIFKVTPKGKHTILYDLCSQGSCADGANGEWLTEGSDGNFYGQTFSGGTANAGTIFEITPSGQFTSLYSFCSQTNCTDGSTPQSALVQASDGTFWGTTISGGANNKGTVFKFVPGNAPTVVYSFCAQSNCADGTYPYTGLTLASDGNFYGVTAEGGSYGANCQTVIPYGCGTVFRITPSGTLTTLYTFCSQPNCTDGGVSQGQLIQAKDGNLYGTTNSGGAEQYGGPGQGTVFKISLQGDLTTVYTFCTGSSCTDGLLPESGVIQAKDGNFYGTALLGGPEGWGSVFQITPKGKFSVVTSFDQTDGASVAAGLVQANNGKLYGGTQEGGNTTCQYGCGVLYSVRAKGGEAIVFNRPSGHAGAIPASVQRPAMPIAVNGR